VFQKRDGFDVLIYAVYVQEYHSTCPEPNSNKVYLSYLDSVGYLKPRRLRTPLYQEVIGAYMTWVRNRGFNHCYIWACPPARGFFCSRCNARQKTGLTPERWVHFQFLGDAYVMYCHPRWQRTPSAERLRKWYAQIVAKLIAENVVVSWSPGFQKEN